MSLIITLHGRDGIVMASDSRITFKNTVQRNGQDVLQFGISQTDTTYKTFLGHSGFGISTFGDATINGAPISGYIEEFLNKAKAADTQLEDIPDSLLDFFQHTPVIPDTGFHVAGYVSTSSGPVQRIWRCFCHGKSVLDTVPAIQETGALWNGEQDILTRLLNDSLHIDNGNGKLEALVHFGVPFQMFTLQDMIDFAVYAIRATADTMRFQMRSKTVGGPVDVLVIKPTESFWISRKELVRREIE